MAGNHWTKGGVPGRSGRGVPVTGAGTGLGLEAAQVLAAHDAARQARLWAGSGRMTGIVYGL
ncbi:hypothetical protein [Streptosporangium vulgare]|uniref:Short-chain dehydrogenase n=1 Tax=Streptosporangium vulgare TaxID=46190 RepID=A0ABV5TLF4_9ACTN